MPVTNIGLAQLLEYCLIDNNLSIDILYNKLLIHFPLKL
jgi:hypothetical protein